MPLSQTVWSLDEKKPLEVAELLDEKELETFDVRRVLPKDYKLFQAADLICTLRLLEIKSENGHLTKSEELIFHSKRQLKKNFIKPIKKKAF